VQLKLFGADLGLDELSDGYQSVLGLTCDIIAGLHASSRGALEAAEGVVVIDELGSHLHPRWRMRVVESLRRAFRRVQFIVSTHDPLCLRGLENGEAIVLRRTNRGRIYPVPDLPPVKGLRVEQLLMSEYFGLDSTMDPEIEAKIRERYRLLALRSPTEKQQQRMAELLEELAPYEVPGATRRERRLLEIIDKELAQTDQEPNIDKRRKLRQDTDLLVADLNQALSKAMSA
jgi:predicted ATP-binding protein involved in virulence